MNGWVNTREAGDYRPSRPLWRQSNVYVDYILYRNVEYTSYFYFTKETPYLALGHPGGIDV